MIDFLRFVVVVVLLIVFFNVDAQLPVITGISGCQDVSPTQTINCPRPVELTLTGSGFMSGGANRREVSVIVLLPNTKTSCDCTVINGGLTDTQLICLFNTAGYGQVVTETLLAVRFENDVTGNVTQLADAVSFAYEYPSRVDRVSGCPVISADGRSASQCDLGGLITTHGVNFSSVDHSMANLTIGSLERNIFMYLHWSSPMIASYSDTQIVFRFDSGNTLYPQEARSGAFLPLILEEWDTGRPAGVPPIWFTEPVYISFWTFPAPVVTSINLIDWGPRLECQIDNSTGSVRYRECITGLVWFDATMKYLYAPWNVTLVGAPGSAKVQTSNHLQFSFQIQPFQSVKGQWYDLSTSSVFGTLVLPSFVQFNHDPLIGNVVPCALGEEDSPLCRPDETLTIKMFNLDLTAPTPQVWIHIRSDSMIHLLTDLIACPNTQVIDQQTITCTTPKSPRKITRISLLRSMFSGPMSTELQFV